MSKSVASRATVAPLAWLPLGGIVLGSLDILFAVAFWSTRDVTATRIFQSVASGVLGNASYSGGVATAWLGAGLHYFIATMMVVVYYLAGRRSGKLVRRPVAFGLPYGLLLYGVMNFVVLPLSAAGLPRFDNIPWVAGSVVMHMVFGVTCALFARSALEARGHR